MWVGCANQTPEHRVRGTELQWQEATVFTPANHANPAELPEHWTNRSQATDDGTLVALRDTTGIEFPEARCARCDHHQQFPNTGSRTR